MELGLYYIDLDKKLGEDFSEYSFDQHGIPLSRYFRSERWKNNPITVCNYSLFHFNRFIRTSSPESKDIFLAQAQWLIANTAEGPDESAVWYYLFDLPYYQIKAPWISGMAQGQALSVLLRAHQLTNEQKFRIAATSVFRIFNIDAANQGVISRFPDGKPVIEEYPSPAMTTSVLNGFIYAIIGVRDYFLYSQEIKAKALFDQFIDSLKTNLFRFDNGYWSYYDQVAPLRLASKPYHCIHIHQLKELYKITNEEIFNEYAMRWQRYLMSPKSHIKWFLKKLQQKLVRKI
jgi:hypothetical protein